MSLVQAALPFPIPFIYIPPISGILVQAMEHSLKPHWMQTLLPWIKQRLNATQQCWQRDLSMAPKVQLPGGVPSGLKPTIRALGYFIAILSATCSWACKHKWWLVLTRIYQPCLPITVMWCSRLAKLMLLEVIRILGYRVYRIFSLRVIPIQAICQARMVEFGLFGVIKACSVKFLFTLLIFSYLVIHSSW